MIEPEIQPHYPLLWPEGRPRTAERKPARFSSAGRNLTWTSSRTRLLKQVRLITPMGRPWRVTDMQLSTNIRITRTGARDQNVSRREPDDPGVAFYFGLDGKAHVLACDRWDEVYGNIAAIAAHIEALRGSASWEEITQAYRRAARFAHPDAGGEEAAWHRLSAAYEAAKRERVT